MIAKDIRGNCCGELFGGVHLLSADGLSWDFAPERKAYSRNLKLIGSDGSVSESLVYHLERPNITFEDGKPLFLTAAYGIDGGEVQPHGGNFAVMSDSRTLIIPLKQ